MASQTVSGFFKDRSSFERTINELRLSGFEARDLRYGNTETGQGMKLTLAVENWDEVREAREIFEKFGARYITSSMDDETLSDYRDESIRSGLDPDRLTDI